MKALYAGFQCGSCSAPLPPCVILGKALSSLLWSTSLHLWLLTRQMRPPHKDLRGGVTILRFNQAYESPYVLLQTHTIRTTHWERLHVNFNSAKIQKRAKKNKKQKNRTGKGFWHCSVQRSCCRIKSVSCEDRKMSQPSLSLSLF